MNFPISTDSSSEKIFKVAKPSLLKVSNELNIDNITDNFFLEIVIPLSIYLNSFEKRNKPYLIALTGGQGSGKTTLSIFIQKILQNIFKKKTTGFSIDDIYKTKDERVEIAKKIHPLCTVRGVPGTHNIKLGVEIIDRLCNADNSSYTPIPSFSKILDQHYPRKDWLEFKGRPDYIFFDGWCVGAKPIPENKWEPPLNKIEKEQDPDQIWAKWSNNELAGDYQSLFKRFDKLIFIKVPKMDNVFENRWLQEKTLSKGIKDKDLLKNIMSKSEVKEFVMHYERLTRFILDEMPDYADIVINRKNQNEFSFIKN